VIASEFLYRQNKQLGLHRLTVTIEINIG
jgi:hypothetical protein